MHSSAVLGLSSHSRKELFWGLPVQSVDADIQNWMGFLGVFKSAWRGFVWFWGWFFFFWLGLRVSGNQLQNQNTALERHMDLVWAYGLRIQETILKHFSQTYTGFPIK